MRRWFWRFMYPLVRLGNALGLLGYEWVNVVRCAWVKPGQGYSLLKHYKWFGDPIEVIPKNIVLCGVPYTVFVSDGKLVFKDDTGLGSGSIIFSREYTMWYVETGGEKPYSHIEHAYEWIRAVGEEKEHLVPMNQQKILKIK